MTMQEMYSSYVEKSGNKFLEEAGNSERVQEIRAHFERFCGTARTIAETKTLEEIVM